MTAPWEHFAANAARLARKLARVESLICIKGYAPTDSIRA